MEKNKTFNIVSLIEQNPIDTLSKTCESKLVNKIKEKFNTKDQQKFLASFYSYLNFNKDDFVVDLDDVWKLMGYNKKSDAKKTLGKNFAEPEDYKILQITDKISEENFASAAKTLHTKTREDIKNETTNKTSEEKAAAEVAAAAFDTKELSEEGGFPPTGGKPINTRNLGGRPSEQILITRVTALRSQIKHVLMMRLKFIFIM